MKKDPWMILTFVLVGLTIFSLMINFDVFSLFDFTGGSITPGNADCSGVQDLIDDIKSGEMLGNMKMKDVDICYENGKPLVYFFGSNSCGYCQWEHPIVEKVAEAFGDSISFHNNMDNNADREVFNEYSGGPIPTAVYGCKYYQIGAGSSLGEQMEEDILTAYMCVITGN